MFCGLWFWYFLIILWYQKTLTYNSLYTFTCSGCGQSCFCWTLEQCFLVLPLYVGVRSVLVLSYSFLNPLVIHISETEYKHQSWVWEWDRKICPRITDCHYESCWVMTIGDREGRIFLSHPHKNKGLFFSLTTRYLIFIGKHETDFHKILNMLRGDLVTYFFTLQWRHGSTCGQRAVDVQLFVFYLSYRLVRVCEIELPHMGKNNGNPDLVGKK